MHINPHSQTLTLTDTLGSCPRNSRFFTCLAITTLDGRSPDLKQHIFQKVYFVVLSPQLQHDLSSLDHRGSATHARSPTLEPECLPKDLEGVPEGAEPEECFDLHGYLTSSNDATQAAGIKHKHVGVTWDDLEVIGIGGEDNKANPPFTEVLSSRI